jgi:hypothetical protein
MKNCVLERDVIQDNLTLSTLEADLRIAEFDKARFATQESLILSRQNEIRQKTRELKDLQLAHRAKRLDVSNFKHQLYLFTYILYPPSVLSICQQPTVNSHRSMFS